MTNLAKYLADWLETEKERVNAFDLVFTEDLLQEALDTYESTEGAVIKVLCASCEPDND